MSALVPWLNHVERLANGLGTGTIVWKGAVTDDLDLLTAEWFHEMEEVADA
jgi:hypothetical protein